jgi:hypothetical protein
MSDIMKSVNVVNKDIVEILNEFKGLWKDNIELMEKTVRLDSKDAVREEYISEEYRNKIINMGTSHNGFPEKLKGYSLKSVGDDRYNHKERADSNFFFNKKYLELNTKLQTILGTYNNALCTVYPPGGFIGWHNNANASAYNLIFTWSETGDGYWKHIDPNTNEEVLVPDVQGWQCKAFYFGAYEDDPKDIVYHMASTDCWRMTISYVFDRQHKDYWLDVIEEIETP